MLKQLDVAADQSGHPTWLQHLEPSQLSHMALLLACDSLLTFNDVIGRREA